MSRSVKHYLNDQCTRLLRNLPFPIRQKVKDFPAIHGKEDAGVVVVLCGPKQFLEGLWSLWSWMNQLNSMMGAVLLFDGKVETRQRILFQKLFPKGRLLEMDAFLKERLLPQCLQRLVTNHWAGKKFAAIYELQKDGNIFYSDCDVLAFSQPDEIVAVIGKTLSAYMFDRIGFVLDPWISSRAEKLGIPITKHFNSGLLNIPRGEMQESLLEAVFSDWQPSFNSHFTEQTLFSALLNHKQLQVLPETTYVLSWQGVWVLEKDLDCSDIVCRHYTGPVRHRMYLSAYPFLLNQVRAGN